MRAPELFRHTRKLCYRLTRRMERCSPGGRATPHRLPATRAAARASGAASAPFLCRHSVRSMWGFPDTPVPALWWFPGQIPPPRQVVRRGTLGHVFANCAAEIGHGPLHDPQDSGAQGNGLRGGAALLRDLRLTLHGLGFEELSVIPPPAQHPTSVRCITPFCRRWCLQGFRGRAEPHHSMLSVSHRRSAFCVQNCLALSPRAISKKSLALLVCLGSLNLWNPFMLRQAQHEWVCSLHAYFRAP